MASNKLASLDATTYIEDTTKFFSETQKASMPDASGFFIKKDSNENVISCKYCIESSVKLGTVTPHTTEGVLNAASMVQRFNIHCQSVKHRLARGVSGKLAFVDQIPLITKPNHLRNVGGITILLVAPLQ